MSSIVIAQIKAIYLLFISIYVAASSARYFTTVPKDREAFLGTDVQLDWDYAVPSSPDGSKVEKVRFGVVLKDPNNENEPREMAIVNSMVKDGKLKWNSMENSINWIRDRIVHVKGRRASFIVKRVQFDDSKTFFCTLDFGRDERSLTEVVNINVVDLLIDEKASTQKAVSWRGNKLRVVCGVKVAPEGKDAKFSWMRLPSNRTVERKYHDDSAKSSYLSMVTYDDQDFERLQCRAATKATVKYHEINITRLYPPSAPSNLKAEKHFEGGIVLITLRWDAPSNTGGAAIDHYRIEYKPKGLKWSDATVAESTTTEFGKLTLNIGIMYNVIVKARNKAGIGSASNEVDVKIGDAQQVQRSVSSARQQQGFAIALLCLQLTVFFL